MPNAVTGLPLSGGTLTGPLVTAGITDTGGIVENTSLSVTSGGATITGPVTVTGALSTAGLTNITSQGGLISHTGTLDIKQAGKGLQVSEGANGKQGRTAAMTAGTITVANTSVTANSEIFLTGQVLGGTAGGLNVSSRTAGTSFTITSTNAADTSTVGFLINEPG